LAEVDVAKLAGGSGAGADRSGGRAARATKLIVKREWHDAVQTIGAFSPQ
jgi:hypothetical protein